jgi:hypothetical protein
VLALFFSPQITLNDYRENHLSITLSLKRKSGYADFPYAEYFIFICNLNLGYALIYKIIKKDNVADPHQIWIHFDADPDSTFHFDADSDAERQIQIRIQLLIKVMQICNH